MIKTDKVFNAIWKIFNDSFARRELFVRVSEANSFPLRLCTIHFSIVSFHKDMLGYAMMY